MSTSDILNKAADLIERDGWWRNKENPGWSDRFPRTYSTMPKCASQAIIAAAGPGLAYFSASEALKSFLGLSTYEHIPRWNDTQCLDQADCVNHLRKAAEEYAE